MKESLLSPRQWAFVVVAGGAACALPFVQTSTSSNSTAPDFRSHPNLAGHNPAGPNLAGPIVPDEFAVSRVSEAEPQQRLPDWASHRSPFDDLASPAQPKAIEEKAIAPLQPLRPWIEGPTPNPSVTSSLPSSSGNQASQTPADPVGMTPIQSIVASSHVSARPEWRDQTPFGATHESGAVHESLARSSSQPTAQTHSSSAGPSSLADNRWPDQRVSPELMEKIMKDQHRDLVSAVVEPNASGILPAPAATRPLAPSTAATLTRNQGSLSAGGTIHRFGSHAASSSSPPSQIPATDPAASQQVSGTLPTLPDARKKQIIFQPSLRRQP